MHPLQIRYPIRIAGVAMLLLVGASCGPGPLDPRATGGQLLPGTEGVDYLGGRPFSISPDGQWMLFSKLVADDAADALDDLESLTLRQLQAFVLYDLGELKGTPLELSAGAREFAASGAALLPDGGCWIPDDGRVVVRGEFGRYLGVDPNSDRPVWEVIESEPFAYEEYCPREVNQRVEPATLGPFQIAHAGDRLVIIVDAHDPHKIFAMHRAPKFPGMGLLLGDVHLTHDGWRLAYTITPHFGSFVANARGFVVSYDAPPERPMVLGSPVYAIQWGPDGSTVFADVEHERQAAIYRWRLPRHGNEKTIPVATR